jgi:DNA-binding CsgD family transcriptional regulator
MGAANTTAHRTRHGPGQQAAPRQPSGHSPSGHQPASRHPAGGPGIGGPGIGGPGPGGPRAGGPGGRPGGPGEPGEPGSGPTTLSREDLELLQMLADGALLGAVARKLQTSERTVRRRIRNICDLLGVDAPIQAVVWAARRGLL